MQLKSLISRNRALWGKVGPFLQGLTAWGGSDNTWGGSGSRLLGKKGVKSDVLWRWERGAERASCSAVLRGTTPTEGDQSGHLLQRGWQHRGS